MNTPRTLARDTEQRLTDGIADALTPFFGEDAAKKMVDERVIERPPRPPEGMVAKLRRLQESTEGQAWLTAHPDASWSDIVSAPL